MKPQINLGARLFLLSLFILIIYLWSLHHLVDEPVIKHIVAIGPLTFIAIISFLSQILKKKETSEIKEKARSWFFFFLKTPVLIILYGFILVAGSVVSSVTVMSSGVPDEMTVYLAPEGQDQSNQKNEKNTTPEGKSQNKKEPKLKGSSDVIRFTRFTTPFGNPYFLEVEGYLRYYFDLYPWVGKKIRVSEDLTISPSILIRVPYEKHGLLIGGSIEVVSSKNIIAKNNTNAKHGSILIGKFIFIPNEFLDKWKTELLLVELDVSPVTAAEILLRWNRPIIVKKLSSKTITPGMILEAKFRNQEGKVIAKANFEVGYEKIQDILMSIVE